MGAPAQAISIFEWIGYAYLGLLSLFIGYNYRRQSKADEMLQQKLLKFDDYERDSHTNIAVLKANMDIMLQKINQVTESHTNIAVLKANMDNICKQINQISDAQKRFEDTSTKAYTALFDKLEKSHNALLDRLDRVKEKDEPGRH